MNKQDQLSDGSLVFPLSGEGESFAHQGQTDLSAQDILDRDRIDLANAIGEAETAVSHLRRLQAAVEAGKAHEKDVAIFVSRSRSALCDAIVHLGTAWSSR